MVGRNARMMERDAAFWLRAQCDLLHAPLDHVPENARKQRQAITHRLANIFCDLVCRLGPPIVLEIGAHEGTFAKTIKQLQPGSRVIAFEAHPHVYAAHAAEAAEAGVEYVESCVADRDGESTIKVQLAKNGLEQLGKGSILGRRKGTRVEYSVQSVTLDGFLVNDADLPNAMWIDVEGALASVLAGAERTLRSCQAVLVELEAIENWQGQMVDLDAMSYLASRGLKPMLRDIQKEGWQYNAIFVRV